MISPQVAPSPREAGKPHPEHGFRLLVDRGNAVAGRFGLVFSLPEDLREIYRGLGIDLTVANGDDLWTLPVPARYVVDRAGIVQAADVDPDYTRRTEPADTIAALRRLTG